MAGLALYPLVTPFTVLYLPTPTPCTFSYSHRPGLSLWQVSPPLFFLLNFSQFIPLHFFTPSPHRYSQILTALHSSTVPSLSHPTLSSGTPILSPLQILLNSHKSPTDFHRATFSLSPLYYSISFPFRPGLSLWQVPSLPLLQTYLHKFTLLYSTSQILPHPNLPILLSRPGLTLWQVLPFTFPPPLA